MNYLNAPCREKIYTVAGPEFGTEEGTIFIVVCALYGLKSAGASWRSFFSQTLVAELGFKPTCGDPDMYIRPQTKPNGFKYYEMILVYVDGILMISHDTNPIISQIAGSFDNGVASPVSNKLSDLVDKKKCNRPSSIPP